MFKQQTKTVKSYSTRMTPQETNQLVVEARTHTLVAVAPTPMIPVQTIKTIAVELQEAEDIIKAIIVMNLINKMINTSLGRIIRK